LRRALKRFKRKFEKTGAIKELRNRQAFEKPSVVRRTESQERQFTFNSYSALKTN
jgi:SSU ribosomal protein S21P